jgi:fructose-1,6-bisphosphatase I
MQTITNLASHLLQQHQHSNEHLTQIINQLVLASKVISRDINRAGLTSILGSNQVTNIQGEEQQKLDDYANRLFIELLHQSPYVRAVGTEESEELVVFDDQLHREHGRFIVYVDPIDGSSNIDVNVSIGTNFVIFEKPTSTNSDTKTTSHTSLEPADYLQPGKNAVAAGYVVYGASTMLVYSTGHGVHGFTLDQALGEYLLSHPTITTPASVEIYSLNESYSPDWDVTFAAYINQLKTKPKPPTARYIGSLVADFHRNLLKGGIYLYPADKQKPEGKLRLMYEAIPFAYLAEQAGGYGSNGTQSILEIIPTQIHQRTPLFIGHRPTIIELEKLLSLG